MSTHYDEDFYAWTHEQAALLRSGKLAEADIARIAEEIEGMGRAEKRELVSRLTILLLHLLKWHLQPTHRGASWEATILNQRLDIADHLADNPSLKAGLDGFMAAAYERARNGAAAETGLARQTFPPECPWSFDEALSADFWPS